MKIISSRIEMEAEKDFFLGLMELQYGKKVEKKLKHISQRVSWAKGWPENKKSFWNAESFMWRKRIDSDKRNLVSVELESSIKKENNLDLGCGAYSYLPSVGFDISEKMLLLNENCTKKVIGDLEEKLPFRTGEFSSVTAVFVLNYIKNYGLLLAEINRILKRKGTFLAVLSSKGINDWQKQKEVNDFSADRWVNILKRNGFKVSFYEKENLWFFKCASISNKKVIK